MLPASPIYGMHTFLTWLRLLIEAHEEWVSPSVLQGYEREFKQALSDVIERTTEPTLKRQFQAMIDCPIRDSKGRCRSFSEYILSALIKNGIHRRYDVEAALGYVFEKMMLPVSDAGKPRTTLFGGFTATRPDSPQQLQARFMLFLQYALRNVRKGKIPRLANVEQRPQGSVSIGQGRTQDDFSGTISPDQIAARPSDEGDFNEIISDIMDLLRKKEAATGLPLLGVFQAITAGQNTQQQRERFGDGPTRAARPVIIQTIKDYAEKSGNYHLLSLLDRFKGFKANQPSPTRRTPVRTVKPVLSPKERDYRSIVAVIEKFDRPVGSADLGRFRRRWLEYAPRTAGSGYRNRLEETLSMMVRDRVLTAVTTAKGATVYSPGPHFDQYRSTNEAFLYSWA